METIETVTDNEVIELLEKGLTIVREKLTPSDIRLICVKVNRDSNTLRRYFQGDVRDVDFGTKLLNLCNAFVAINGDCDEQKKKLEF